MNSDSSSATCPKCGVSLTPPQKFCPQCEQAVPEERTKRTSAGEQPFENRQHSSFSFSIASLLIGTVLSAIFFALLLYAPGLAIMYAILLVPPLVRTGLVIGKRSRQGEKLPIERKLVLLFGSLGVTCAISVLLAVASAGVFGGVCFAGLVLTDTLDSLGGVLIISGVVATASTIVAIWISIRWIVQRWRSDTHSRDDTEYSSRSPDSQIESLSEKGSDPFRRGR